MRVRMCAPLPRPTPTELPSSLLFTLCLRPSISCSSVAHTQVMFNLLAIRSAAIPRLERQLAAASSATDRMLIGDQLDAEKAKASQGKFENALRRHNMLPLVLGLLEALHGSQSKGESQCSREEGGGRREECGWWVSVHAD